MPLPSVKRYPESATIQISVWAHLPVRFLYLLQRPSVVGKHEWNAQKRRNARIKSKIVDKKRWISQNNHVYYKYTKEVRICWSNLPWKTTARSVMRQCFPWKQRVWARWKVSLSHTEGCVYCPALPFTERTVAAKAMSYEHFGFRCSS